MRRLLLVFLALSGLAFAPASISLPRGNADFRLGWARSQVDSALAARGVTPQTAGADFITTSGETPEVEYVEYSFLPAPFGSPLLWRVIYGYRVPYDHTAFESARGTLLGDLGQPNDEHHADPENGDVVDKLTWVDALTSVQLGARWTERQDPGADRMLVTWIDRKLQKVISVVIKKRGEKK
ncbi:MAG: hypothetical protein E6K80_04105 [Candidatus Eisenbacteria bacterium]|uniref:DUF4136 domain-containing protein n=1 Tax=Eiseniibacteriota bacterium TaxID=2212470 RepID=A0A538U7R0_UNCEI|nr:MAG: hypothetical protein E6K80_04105 [Candidatus Eisenbacteria bacterium]